MSTKNILRLKVTKTDTNILYIRVHMCIYVYTRIVYIYVGSLQFFLKNIDGNASYANVRPLSSNESGQPQEV